MKKKLIGFKRFLNLTLAFLMVVTSIAWNGLTVEAATATEGNLIKNGDFEEVSTDGINFEDWVEVRGNKTGVDMEKYDFAMPDPDPEKSDNTVLHTLYNTAKIYQIFEVESGQKYELSGYIYMGGLKAFVEAYKCSDADATSEIKSATMMFTRVAGETLSNGLTIYDVSTGNKVGELDANKWYKFTRTITAATDYMKVLIYGANGHTYFDDISLYKVVDVTNITLNKTELALTVGAEETLSATIAPEDATDKTVSWKSTSDAVATVDASGKVTAVGVGSATISATTTNGKSATCAVTVTAAQTEEPVVSVNGTEYGGTLLEAIAAADTGDTITLRKDINSEEEISLSKGTLDLNGKTLTAPSLIAFEGTDVVDKSESKTGLLKVTTFTPGKDNSQMPIYNGTGYVFIDFEDIVKQEEGSTVSEDVFKLVFKPLFGTTNTALGSLGDGAGVSFRIRLKWTDENDDEQTKDLYWSSDLIKQVYANSMAFSVTASGVSKYKSLTITPLIQSTLNPEIEWLVGTEYSVNPVN